MLVCIVDNYSNVRDHLSLILCVISLFKVDLSIYHENFRYYIS